MSMLALNEYVMFLEFPSLGVVVASVERNQNFWHPDGVVFNFEYASSSKAQTPR